MKKLARPEPPCVNIARVIALRLPEVPGTNHSACPRYPPAVDAPVTPHPTVVKYVFPGPKESKTVTGDAANDRDTSKAIAAKHRTTEV